MNSEQAMVAEFHREFKIPVALKPAVIPADAIIRRVNLMTEELLELREALYSGDLAQIADGMADLLYVVYGTAVECGLDMEPLFAEVHRSNMTKKGGHKREDGKWIKPPNYSPADLRPIIDQQLYG